MVHVDSNGNFMDGQIIFAGHIFSHLPRIYLVVRLVEFILVGLRISEDAAVFSALQAELTLLLMLGHLLLFV